MQLKRYMTGLAIAAGLVVPSSASAVSDFKTPKNAAYCASDEYTGNHFACWTPNDGFTVFMSTNGTVTKQYRSDARGYYDRHVGRTLRYGQSGRFGGSRQFRCTSSSTGLTCTNRRGHGWRLGVFVGYEIF